jgi:hypothetical protein
MAEFKSMTAFAVITLARASEAQATATPASTSAAKILFSRLNMVIPQN